MLQSGGAARILAMRHPLTAPNDDGGRAALDVGGFLSVHLDQLADAAGVTVLNDAANPEIRAVSFDSREAKPGDLFACVPGDSVDGHDFAPIALEAGAVAFLCEHELGIDAAQLIVPSVRDAIGPIARLVYGSPDAALEVVGVTGTNGKTTSAFMIESILTASGRRAGLSGTIETRIAGEVEPVRHTTPEAPELYALLQRMVESRVEAVALEVSSHALDQGRIAGVEFAVGAFTNLTQDHLDYHTDMEDYFDAKASLFSPGRVRHAAINVGDEYGRRIAERCRDLDIFTITFRTDRAGVEGETPDIGARVIEVRPDALALELSGPWGARNVGLRMGGTFNAENAACAAACAVALGIGVDAIVDGLEAMAPVPGRFEPIVGGQSFGVIVDYAHTPDGVENVLRAARAVMTSGRLICVVGCGGDRDRAKRPRMGEAAGRLADHVVVTSDNPRSEDPDAIIDEIVPGVEATGTALDVEVDRRRAIALAFAAARSDDVVVIAGKGHERGQEVAGVVRAFDDREVAREELAGMRERGSGGE